jgi:hypothetical protein
MTQYYQSLAPFRAPAVANWGMWKVRCIRCSSADTFPPGTPVFRCAECGATAEIEWPSDEMVHGVERLLLMRPSPANQNWQPGETLLDLMVENAEHGIYTFPEGYELAATALVVEAERIRMDTLPATHRRELSA